MLAACCISLSAIAQSVIFPQAQQPGKAYLTTEEADGTTIYTLGNDLFSAQFVQTDGKLIFDGCEAMNLLPGSELFKVAQSANTEYDASQLTLKSVECVPLEADFTSVRGAEKLDGQSLRAVFTKGNLTYTWQAILRDGSHYLRTALDITASRNTQMHHIIPLTYDVDSKTAGSVPVVSGDTRGSVIISDNIFAGLETPTGNNTAAAHDDMGNFDPYTWSVPDFTWQPATLPAALTKLGYSATKDIIGKRGYINIKQSGNITVTFQYTSGNLRLDIAGIDLVDPTTQQVVASDYHHGYTGGNKSNNVYTFNVPAQGIYLVRYFIDLKSDGYQLLSGASYGNITYSCDTEQVPAEQMGGNELPAVTPIQGLWSRNATLKAGDTWHVSAVVGIVAPGQQRRSFLAYSERERAVPWHPCVIYNSWYELNIDRNNASEDNNYKGNFTEAQCLDVIKQWKQKLFDPYGVSIDAFVWDDGWDEYGVWDFNCNFPNGFSKIDAAAKEMGVGIGAWLGPRGGYGGSGQQRQAFWNNKGRTKQLWTTGQTITSNGKGMYLSNEPYHDLFLQQINYMMENYDFRFFKFDGISAQSTAHGPGTAAQGDEENIEGMIDLETRARQVKPDIFLNSTVGTYASPFWFQYTDAVWRQDADWSTLGNQGDDRERWITYRDHQVFQHFVSDAPICPINTLMTHGVILTKHGAVSKTMTYKGIVRELRCAFACGSSMVELYCDYERLNNINKGALWNDIAECIQWQQDNADVLPDIHWVGGNPWDGQKANIYGWAAWNGSKATLALRNPATTKQTLNTTLRQALDIPPYISTSITLTHAFKQDNIDGLPIGEPIDIDTPLTLKMPASSVMVFNGVDENPRPEFIPTHIRPADTDPQPTVGTAPLYDLSGRPVSQPHAGITIQNGRKFITK